MKRELAVMAAVVACLMTGSALAEEAPAADTTEIVNTVCAMCHGEDGNKMLTPETPKIGGQKGDYLAKALHDYKAGARNNAIMAAVAQPLSKEQIEALAAYFSSQKPELYTFE